MRPSFYVEMVTGKVILLLLVAGLASLASLDAHKMVRIILQKDISMQGGYLEQPAMNFYARTNFGTPAKSFNMLIDINAREVWLPHHLKMGLVYSRLNYKKGYQKADSQTSMKEPNEVYKVDYKGTELSGKAYRDVVEFPDVLEGARPVKFEQRFLAMSSASNDRFSKYFSNIDGVLAFNPWPISETGSDLVCVAMNRANVTSELKLGLSLDDDLDTKNGGELSIGALNDFKFFSDPKYHHLTSQHSWEVRLQKVMLGANTLDACSGSSCRALISTTSNDIIGSETTIRLLLKFLGVVDEVDKKFHSATVYKIDCLKVATAPPLTFVIDGVYYTVPPTSYIRKRVEGVVFKTTSCYVALLSNESSDQWILGTNFLSNYYSIFDMQKRAVAFVLRK